MEKLSNHTEDLNELIYKDLTNLLGNTSIEIATNNRNNPCLSKDSKNYIKNFFEESIESKYAGKHTKEEMLSALRNSYQHFINSPKTNGTEKIKLRLTVSSIRSRIDYLDDKGQPLFPSEERVTKRNVNKLKRRITKTVIPILAAVTFYLSQSNINQTEPFSIYQNQTFLNSDKPGKPVVILPTIIPSSTPSPSPIFLPTDLPKAATPTASPTETENKNEVVNEQSLIELFKNYKGLKPITGNEEFLKDHIILTIDSNHSFDNMKIIFDLLHKNGVKAILFPNPGNIDINNPNTQSLWRSMYEDGFEIGYGTVNHENSLNSSQLNTDYYEFIEKMKILLNDKTYLPNLARAPQGAFDKSWMMFTEKMKLTNIEWNYAPDQGEGENIFIENIKNGKGQVVLLHDFQNGMNWINQNISTITRYKQIKITPAKRQIEAKTIDVINVSSSISRSMSLADRYDKPSINDVYKYNILLALRYMSGSIISAKQINQNDIDKPFNYSFTLNPNEEFAFHDNILPALNYNVVKTTNTHFDSKDGFKSDGHLTGDGACHLASLIYWAAKDANLTAYAPANHNFATIPDIPQEFSISINANDTNNYSPATKQNLYIINNKSYPIRFIFSYDENTLKITIQNDNATNS